MGCFYDAFWIGTQMTVIYNDDGKLCNGVVSLDSFGNHYLAFRDGSITYCTPDEVLSCKISDPTCKQVVMADCAPYEVVFCSMLEDVTIDFYLHGRKKEKRKMKKRVVGKQKVDYVSKKTNQPVTGITLHCECDVNDDRFEGKQVETIFVSSKSPMYDQCLAFPIGSVVNVMYNRWGSVDSVVLDK